MKLNVALLCATIASAKFAAHSSVQIAQVAQTQEDMQNAVHDFMCKVVDRLVPHIPEHVRPVAEALIDVACADGTPMEAVCTILPAVSAHLPEGFPRKMVEVVTDVLCNDGKVDPEDLDELMVLAEAEIAMAEDNKICHSLRSLIGLTGHVCEHLEAKLHALMDNAIDRGLLKCEKHSPSEVNHEMNEIMAAAGEFQSIPCTFFTLLAEFVPPEFEPIHIWIAEQRDKHCGEPDVIDVDAELLLAEEATEIRI